LRQGRQLPHEGHHRPEWHGQLRAGLDPSSQAWSATVAAMLSYQGLHVLLLLVAPYLLASSWSGGLGVTSRATMDNSALIWHYTTLQGLVFAAAVNLPSRLMDWPCAATTT
jgi:cytochrome c oxidase subunit I+III